MIKDISHKFLSETFLTTIIYTCVYNLCTLLDLWKCPALAPPCTLHLDFHRTYEAFLEAAPDVKPQLKQDLS